MTKKDKLRAEFDKVELKPCSMCGNNPILFNRDAVYIIKCSKCGHNARGYIIEICLRVDNDYSKSINKLADSWNSRN